MPEPRWVNVIRRKLRTPFSWVPGMRRVHVMILTPNEDWTLRIAFDPDLRHRMSIEELREAGCDLEADCREEAQRVNMEAKK